MKINNHFLPRFHIKKWSEQGGLLFNKNTSKKRKINIKDFSKKKYYSIDGTDSLENRIANFEAYVSEIIHKVDNADEEIKITGKELFLLKLYCAFCSYRHQFTSEVILEDDFGIYQSNNYLWGVKKYTKKEDVLYMTEEIIKVFENVKNDQNFTHLENFTDIICSKKVDYIENPFQSLYGLHLSIIRSNEKWMCISERCAIIENTLDSDHLFTYVPVSPKTALLLVKTKYYRDQEKYDESRSRLAYKNCGLKPDPYLSIIFGGTVKQNYDSALFCSYYKPFVKSNVHINGGYLPNDNYSNVLIKINTIPKEIIDNFNAIFFQDGNKFIYIFEEQLDRAKKLITDYRYISCNC
ncbi:MAG: DUF4238 domain-containing protein [Bacilli bacterium]|jgi:hypothetical protein